MNNFLNFSPNDPFIQNPIHLLVIMHYKVYGNIILEQTFLYFFTVSLLYVRLHVLTVVITVNYA